MLGILAENVHEQVTANYMIAGLVWLNNMQADLKHKCVIVMACESMVKQGRR